MFTMMRRVYIGLSLAVLLAFVPGIVFADPPPKREVIIQVSKTAYIWVVGAWNFETCRILTDDLEIVPQYADVSALCGIKSTSLINSGSANIYYLGKYNYLEDVPQPLPEIIIRSSFINGAVIVESVDPLPGHAVNKIDATINGIPAVCDFYNGTPIPFGLKCTFPTYQLPILFYAFATSTYGDNSRNIELRIGKMIQKDSIFSVPIKNVVIVGDNAYTKYNLYHDVPRVWGVVPGSDNIPSWLKTVPTEQLITDHYYYYLAGQILLNGVANARNCWNGGISGENPGYSTNCGVLSVFDDVCLYQNAYNEEITQASERTGIPNRLIKRIIAIESQFYPNAYGIAGERGLYQFTRDGADTLFRWNYPFYLEVCGEYWDYCDSFGYDALDQWQRDVLINRVLADPNNIYFLGSALKANAYQVKRLLNNVSRIDVPGDVLSYEDLWKITVLNYHGGATLTGAVLVNIRDLDLLVSWDSFATVLEDLQPSVLRYVNRVYRGY